MSGILRIFFGDIHLKIIALLLGFLLWFLASIERTYRLRIGIATKISAPDSGYVLNDLLPDSINTLFVGTGSRLIPIRINPPDLLINLKGRDAGKHTLVFEKDQLNPNPNPNISIEFIPRRIRFNLVKESRRYVNLWVPVVGEPKSGYTISKIERPEKILLRGAKDLLVKINEVVTETLLLRGTKNNIDTILEVIPPSNLIYTDPKVVPITVNIEPTAEKTFSDLPVSIDRRPNQLVMIEPERATINISGPKSHIDTIDASIIEIKINIRNKSSGEFKMPAQITLPAGFDLVSSDPKNFKVSIK